MFINNKCRSIYSKWWLLICLLIFTTCVNAQQDLTLPPFDKSIDSSLSSAKSAGAVSGLSNHALPAAAGNQLGAGGQNLMKMLQGQGGGATGAQQSLKDMLGPDDVADIHGPIHIVSPWLYVGYGVGIILIILLLWLLIRYIKRPKPIIIRKFYEIAFEQLVDLKKSMSDKSSREFSISISNVVRTYIEGRFNVTSTSSTTDEFMDTMRDQKNGPLKDHSQQLHDFLGYCDQAKFAGCELTGEQVTGMMDSAWSFVDETKDDGSGSQVSDQPVDSKDEVIVADVVSKGGVS